MSEVLPFQGIRFDVPRIGGDMWPVLSPPWDKITPKIGETLRSAHPNNMAHLVVPAAGEVETPWPASARLLFDKWLQSGVINRDPGTGFYGCRMTFTHQGTRYCRSGFMGLCRLGRPEVSKVHPHERIFPDHYQTRLALIRETRTNFEPVFLIYPDPKEETISLLGEPDRVSGIRAEDPDQNIVYEFWPVFCRDRCERIQQLMAARDLLIADGHHRYGAAQAYAEEWHANNPTAPAVTGVDYRMCYLTPLESDGVLILPTHRVFRGLLEHLPALESSMMARYFQVVSDQYGNEKQLLDAMWAHREREPHAKVLGLFDGTRFVLLRWTGAEPDSYSTTHAERTSVWKSLDVNVLHEILLLGVLKWNRGTDSQWVSHHRDAGTAVAEVRAAPG
ncbi:MAG TPA: DUF1015 domain-containing protein, partial [bacterium]|nr:DUF1015 domain-containing protein [bacterium]